MMSYHHGGHGAFSRGGEPTYHDRQCTYKEYLRDCNIYTEFKEQNFKKVPLVSSSHTICIV